MNSSSIISSSSSSAASASVGVERLLDHPPHHHPDPPLITVSGTRSTVGSFVGSLSVTPSPFAVSTVSSPSSDISNTSAHCGLVPLTVAVFSTYHCAESSPVT